MNSRFVKQPDSYIDSKELLCSQKKPIFALSLFSILLIPICVHAADVLLQEPNTLYIDSVAGSDSNIGTRSDLPRKSIPSSVAPGTTVRIKGGQKYPALTITGNGTSDKRIIYNGNSDGKWGQGRAVIDGFSTGYTGIDVQADYIRIEGFEVRGFNARGINVEYYNWNTHTAYGNHLQIVNNLIHDIASQYDTNLNNSGIGKGIQLRYVDDVLIENNEIYRTNYDAITLDISNITIRGNHLHDGYNDGIKGSAGGLTLIENNRIHDFKNSDLHGDGVQILGWDKLIIRNNIAGDSTQNLFIEPYATTLGSYVAGPVYVYNNVVYNSNPGADGLGGYYNGIVFDNYVRVSEAHVYGNTLINLNSGSGGLRLDTRAPTFNGLKPFGIANIRNNIFYNSSNIGRSRSDIVDNLQVSNNLYFNQYRSGYDEIAAAEAGSLYGDPKFIDPSKPDFNIQSSSPAVNQGYSIPSTNGIFFNFDLLGGARPAGQFDIGAYEYGSQAAAFHPADSNRDSEITIDESTNYGKCWKDTCVWPFPPNPIDVNYVTKAGSIWQAGGKYSYDPSMSPPDCWKAR